MTNISDDDIDELYVDCVACRWVLEPIDNVATCKAFPDGIPLNILKGKVGHIRPIDGDHGIQFAPEP
jgi:hypothetical protein